MAIEKPVVVLKPEQIILENKSLVSEALALMSQSRGRAMSKVKNSVILREMQLELDKLQELRRAVNTL